MITRAMHSRYNLAVSLHVGSMRFCICTLRSFRVRKGALARRNGDPATLEIAPVSLGRTFAKYSLIARPFQEIQVGHQRIRRFEPDVVLGCNLPLHALWQVLRGCLRSNRPFVFWQQDIYSTAITRILTKKLGTIGRVLGAYYRRIEGRAVRASAAVVVIADDFLNAIRNDFGFAGGNVHVIENWAPVEEIAPRSKGNSWAVKHQLASFDVVLYTGTLGMKHDPARIFPVGPCSASTAEHGRRRYLGRAVSRLA